ncbi:MAG: hypothetical protein B6245_21000 [Desulfobacteraceae bacterium 4572_88]|nr:MAG: hypothetical protein B6245_21000 [Desulfobacteraceae bacterium 4572_88]
MAPSDQKNLCCELMYSTYTEKYFFFQKAMQKSYDAPAELQIRGEQFWLGSGSTARLSWSESANCEVRSLFVRCEKKAYLRSGERSVRSFRIKFQQYQLVMHI